MQAIITCFFFVIVCILLFEPTVLGLEYFSLYGGDGCDVKDGSGLFFHDKFIRNLTEAEIEEARVFEEKANANIENVFAQLQASQDNGQGLPGELEGEDYPHIPAFCTGLGADKNVTDSPPPNDGVTDSPPPNDGVTDSPPPIDGVTDSPPPVDGVTDSPPPNDGVTDSPPPIDGC